MLRQGTINLIRIYQKFISPITGRHCRFYPSCSEYSLMAVKKYGVGKGLLLGLWRIIRCNRFSKGGVDMP